jgi:hypothetical protein
MNWDRIKTGLKSRLTKEQVQKLKGMVNRSRVVRRLYGSDLPNLALIYGSDKWGDHWYAQHYQTHFRALRNARINLLEIGIGGYEHRDYGGESLRMWKAYFPRAEIFAIDIVDKTHMQEPRIHIYQGSQDDPDLLRRVAADMGRIDIVVDDGSHMNAHVITSFETLFPLLADGGIYAIEDIQTSYWAKFGGSEDTHHEGTSIAMCKRFADGLNWEEIPGREPSYYDKNIKSIHFYHNLVFIYKGNNIEGSNREGVLEAIARY